MFRTITPPRHVIERNAAQIRARNNERDARSTPRLTSEAAYEIIVGGTTSSGASVNANTALGVAAVSACVGLLSDMVALLPLKLMRTTPSGDIEDAKHPAAKTTLRPGDLHTSFEFRQLLMAGVALGGNGYAKVYRDGSGAPIELEWLSPGTVQPERIDDRRFITYRVSGDSKVYTRYDIIHVRGLSRDGIMGVSPITQLRESIGTSIAQREAAGSMMKNGARFNGVIEAPPSLRPEQLKDIRNDWKNLQEGSSNAGRTPVLWGAQFKAVSGMSAVDAQFLESRRFELQEIARLYRIPSFLIGDTTANTSWGSGIEQQNLGFLAYSLNPWLVNCEQSFDYTLLTTDEQADGLHFSFDREELGAVSLQAQASFLATMRTIGAFSVNDVRRWMDYPTVTAAGADDYGLPLNSSASGANNAPKDTSVPAQSAV